MAEINNISRHSIEFFDNLKENRHKLCDVQLKVQDTLIPAHKIVLASSSEYFHHLFAGTISYSDSNTAIIAMESKYSLDSIKSIVDYIYYGKLNFSAENATNLLLAANFYRMEFIVENCREFLSANLTDDNCIEIRCLFELLGFNIDEIDKFVADHIVNVSKNLDFLCISDQMIIKFFTSVLRFIQQKLAVGFYLAIINWIKYDESRQSLCTDLIKLFPMKMKYLNAILPHITHEELILKNNGLLKCFLNAKTNGEPYEDYSNSIFIMEKSGSFYWIFNPDTLEIKRKKSPIELTGFTLTTIDSKVFIIGGKLNNGEHSKVCHIFDPDTYTWSKIPFPYETENYKACHLNRKIYLLGSKNKNVEMISFDVETQTIKKLADSRCQNYFNIFVSEESLHIVYTRSYIDQTLKIGIDAFDNKKNSWQEISTYDFTFQETSPTIFNTERVESTDILPTILHFPIEQLMANFDVIQMQLQSMPNFPVSTFTWCSNMIVTNSTIYSLAKDGIYRIESQEWENILKHDFEGATATPLEE